MKRKSLVLWIAVAAVVGGGTTYGVLRPENPTEVVTTRAERVRTLKSVVSATGEIRAKEFVDIQAEVAGVIVDLPVREGDYVHKGEVLLRLDATQLEADRDAMKAQLESVKSDAKSAEVGVATAIANLAASETALANLRVDLEQARITKERSESSFQRKKELYRKNLIGSEEYEAAEAEARLAAQKLGWAEARVEQGKADRDAMRTRVDAAKAARDGARSRITAAEANLARAEDLLSKTEIRSPLDGLITRLNVEKGERAVPGIQSNPIATLMTIADMSVVEAELKVDETDIVTVALGQRAEVEVDALRGVKMPGVVTEIGHSPIQQDGSGQEGKDFKVVVRLESPPESLRPGFTATADIVTATRENCLVIPLQALTAREVDLDENGAYVPPPEPGSGPPRERTAEQRARMKELEGVFLMVDGRARFRPVKTGITGEMDIEVLEGLADGDVVVAGPYQVLRTVKEWDRIAVDEKKRAEAEALLRRKRK
ncbi:MAG: efflux RND transporter periplasmic adaptor subunit [Planctomycetota bacterium]